MCNGPPHPPHRRLHPPCAALGTRGRRSAMKRSREWGGQSRGGMETREGEGDWGSVNARQEA